MKPKSTFIIYDNNLRDLDLGKEYPTLDDLMREQGVSKDFADYWDKECDILPSNSHCLDNHD